MPPYPHISVPQPCAQSWDAMTPTAAGRHCATCATTVTDFTRHTDAELLAHFRRASAGRVCGRFRAGQLDRPLRLGTAAAPASRWRAGLAALVALWGLREVAAPAARAQVSLTQQQPTPATTAPPTPDAVTPADVKTANAPWVIRGQVFDKSNRQGVPGVTVLIIGTPYGCSTDALGNFALSVPKELTIQAEPVTLRFSSIGFASQEITVSALRLQLPIIALEADTRALTGEVCVINYRKPWPWHPRRFWFWLTRPLRG